MLSPTNSTTPSRDGVGDTLFRVTGHLARRYADALRSARNLDCALESFSIDRSGWSPELAHLLGPDYLGVDALCWGIILSPDQESAPLLHPRSSFEIVLLQRVYGEARSVLLDLIQTEPVILELDIGLSRCHSPADVLAIKRVEGRLSTPSDLPAKVVVLLALAERLEQEHRMLDDAYIAHMLSLVAEVGDPRQRQPPVKMAVETRSLWIDLGAKGEVYVLRAPEARSRPIVIAEDLGDQFRALPADARRFSDPALIDRLQADGFCRFDPDLVEVRCAQMERNALLMAGVSEPADDPADRRRQLARTPRVESVLPPVYWELDTDARRMRADGALVPGSLSIAARWAIATPASPDDGIVQRLLARYVACDFRLLQLDPERLRAQWAGRSPQQRRFISERFPFIDEWVRVDTNGKEEGAHPAPAEIR